MLCIKGAKCVGSTLLLLPPVTSTFIGISGLVKPLVNTKDLFLSQKGQQTAGAPSVLIFGSVNDGFASLGLNRKCG